MAVDLQRLEIPFAFQGVKEFDVSDKRGPAGEARAPRDNGLCVRETERCAPSGGNGESARLGEMVDERLGAVAIAVLPCREERLGLAAKVVDAWAGWERVGHRASMHGLGSANRLHKGLVGFTDKTCTKVS